MTTAARERRRNLIMTVAALALLIGPVVARDAWAEAYWAETLGGSAGGEKVLGVYELPSGELMVPATTDSFGFGMGEFWLLKLGADGTVVSEQVFGAGLAGGVQAAQILSDGSAITVGAHAIGGFPPDFHGWFMKIDANGLVEWATTFANLLDGRYHLYDVKETPDGGFIATGSTSVYDFPPFYLWVVKVDATGTLVWQKRYGGGTSEDGRRIILTSDGGYAIVGKSNSSGEGMEDVLVLKLDAAGAIQWQKTYGGADIEEGTGIVQLPDGGYAVSAVTGSFNPLARAGWVFRIDASGNLVWNTVVGTNTWCDFQNIEATGDGDLVAVGSLEEPGYPSVDLWLVKLDATDGSVIWQRGYEGNQGDWGLVARELTNNDLVIGATFAGGFPAEDLWILRTDMAGRIESCSLIRDTAVTTTSPKVDPKDGVLTVSAPDGVPTSQTFTPNPSAAAVSVQCAYSPPLCSQLSCDTLTIDPEPVCSGDAQTFTLLHTGGEPPVQVEWDFDGDAQPDAVGNPVSHTFTPGAWPVTATATDSCANPAPQTCFLESVATVHPNPTPTITPDGPTSFCAQKGESVTLSSEAGYMSYQWTRNGTDIPGAKNDAYTATATGDYTVTVTDGNGCSETSAVITIDADVCPCETLVCGPVTVAPDPVCEGVDQIFTIQVTGGEGPVLVEWDYDGDSQPDSTGSPSTMTLPTGVWNVEVTVTDSCADPGPQTCQLSIPATVLDTTPPLEVSNQLAGDPAVLVDKTPGGLKIAKVPNAVAYNIYTDAIGSWYYPTLAKGSVCTIQTWVDNGDGTVNLDFTIPDNAWFTVTASTSCAEGPAGTNSLGQERTTVGVWELCGPAL